MAIDLPGYGSKESPDDEYEYCECGRTHRPICSNKICDWCECSDQDYDERRDRELLDMVEEE